ncbi:MAG TPA: carbohydrate ABC transporter permease [Anaerolineales bacterium]|nr:carbohydrate ABC transporter permease [Anaerolineales bacterium]
MAATTSAPPTGYGLRKRIREWITYLAMSALAIFFLFPIVFMLVSSVKNSETQVLADMSNLYAFVPRGDLGLQNYRDVFGQLEFGRLVVNSTFIMVLTVLVGLLVNSLIAYALARLRFKGRDFLLGIVVALIIVPFEAVAVPLLLLVNRLPWFGGASTWLDSYQVQIIPFIADAFSIFLFYQFFINIPKDLEEAALVDGASLFRIYWNIILPLSRPIFATVAILQALAAWNRFMWPLMVTRGIAARPLTVGMQSFFGQDPRLWGDLMAFASMITIPVLIIFLLFQKWFVQSVASTGIKG